MRFASLLLAESARRAKNAFPPDQLAERIVEICGSTTVGTDQKLALLGPRKVHPTSVCGHGPSPEKPSVLAIDLNPPVEIERAVYVPESVAHHRGKTSERELEILERLPAQNTLRQRPQKETDKPIEAKAYREVP